MANHEFSKDNSLSIEEQLKKLHESKKQTKQQEALQKRDLRLNLIPMVWLLLRSNNPIVGILFLRKPLINFQERKHNISREIADYYSKKEIGRSKLSNETQKAHWSVIFLIAGLLGGAWIGTLQQSKGTISMIFASFLSLAYLEKVAKNTDKNHVLELALMEKEENS